MLKAIHAQESKTAAREKAKAVVTQLREMKLKEAALKNFFQRLLNHIITLLSFDLSVLNGLFLNYYTTSELFCQGGVSIFL